MLPVPRPCLKIMFGKRALHKYVYVYTYTDMWKTLYQNTIFELGIGIAISFSGMALTAFWKRALPLCFTKMQINIVSPIPCLSICLCYRSSIYTLISVSNTPAAHCVYLDVLLRRQSATGRKAFRTNICQFKTHKAASYKGRRSLFLLWMAA